MTATLLEKARAGRRAALASLSHHTDRAENVISLFEEAPQPRKSIPEFRSVRRHVEPELTHSAPVLVLDQRIAA
ncbi:MAG: hypothetical protein P8X50_10875 [Maritimibacter sp.]|jgi:hypothetical protein